MLSVFLLEFERHTMVFGLNKVLTSCSDTTEASGAAKVTWGTVHCTSS